eukprot:441412-Amphidinium_carterae.1
MSLRLPRGGLSSSVGGSLTKSGCLGSFLLQAKHTASGHSENTHTGKRRALAWLGTGKHNYTAKAKQARKLQKRASVQAPDRRALSPRPREREWCILRLDIPMQ